MKLKEALINNKPAILKLWLKMLAETYPPDAARFYAHQKDPFANPVGGTARKSLEAVFDSLLDGPDFEKLTPLLDPIIRIRAVQTFSPSRAVSFIFFIKQIVRTQLKDELNRHQLDAELAVFESRVDETALAAFDIFMKCREKIYQIKAFEERKRTYGAFERAGIIRQIRKDEPGL